MVKPYRTSEVRWFFSGAIPSAVTNWFVRTLPGDWREGALIREDVYLLVPGRDDIGLKFRKDRVQLKLRCDRYPFSVLKGRISGVETDWERYSWAYDKKENDFIRAFSGQAGEGRRVAVVKKRRQRIYDLMPDGRLRPLAPRKKAKAPVFIEVTEIAFPGFTGWSLQLELVNPHAEVRGHLPLAAVELLRKFPALPLKRRGSLDYPAMIRRRALSPKRAKA